MEQVEEGGALSEVRIPAREGPVKLRVGEYLGHGGEVLKRQKFQTVNKFDFPNHLKKPGWSYQWIRGGVLGDLSLSELPLMKSSGWREVPPQELNNYYKDVIPDGQNHIMLDGMILMWRPEGMTIEAQQETLDAANYQYRMQIHKIYDNTAKLPAGVIEPLGEYIREDRGRPEAAPKAWQPPLKPRATPMPMDGGDE